VVDRAEAWAINLWGEALDKAITIATATALPTTPSSTITTLMARMVGKVDRVEEVEEVEEEVVGMQEAAEADMIVTKAVVTRVAQAAKVEAAGVEEVVMVDSMTTKAVEVQAEEDTTMPISMDRVQDAKVEATGAEVVKVDLTATMLEEAQAALDTPKTTATAAT
jgi:hypothetical protein